MTLHARRSAPPPPPPRLVNRGAQVLRIEIHLWVLGPLLELCGCVCAHGGVQGRGRSEAGACSGAGRALLAGKRWHGWEGGSPELNMRRISLDSLFTIVRSFLSHSTGTEYLPGHRRAGACGCVWAGVRGWAWAGGCMVLLLRRTTTRPNSPRSLCSRPLTPSVVGQLVQIAHKPHAVDGVGHAGVVAGEGPLPAGAAEGGVAWDSGHSRGGVSVRGAPRARAHAAAAARAPGLTNSHPECWSASGRVRCQVGAVTLRPITSSKPCARVGVHASVSLRAVEHARDAPPPH